MFDTNELQVVSVHNHQVIYTFCHTFIKYFEHVCNVWNLNTINSLIVGGARWDFMIYVTSGHCWYCMTEACEVGPFPLAHQLKVNRLLAEVTLCWGVWSQLQTHLLPRLHQPVCGGREQLRMELNKTKKGSGTLLVVLLVWPTGFSTTCFHQGDHKNKREPYQALFLPGVYKFDFQISNSWPIAKALTLVEKVYKLSEWSANYSSKEWPEVTWGNNVNHLIQIPVINYG